MAVNPEGLWPEMPEPLQKVDIKLTNELNGLEVVGPELFSARQLQVIRLAADDRDVNQSAKALGVAKRTLENHRSGAQGKARMTKKSFAGVVNLACHSGWIEHETLPPYEVESPEEALFLKCAALGVWHSNAKSTAGVSFSVLLQGEVKSRLGVVTASGLVFQCYQRRLFVPKSRLPNEEAQSDLKLGGHTDIISQYE